MPAIDQQQYQADRRATIVANITTNARNQATPEARENYLCSCEAHGGELAEVVAEFRKTLDISSNN